MDVDLEMAGGRKPSVSSLRVVCKTLTLKSLTTHGSKLLEWLINSCEAMLELI